MQPRVNWIDNLRGIACLMVILIHTTTWYITNANRVSLFSWDFANVLNSASRVSVPLFFMISGYLFFGERSARRRHFLRIGLCLLFYSSVAFLYIWLFTAISPRQSLISLFQKPVFYHLWFFFAIVVIYLVSPLISVKKVGLPVIFGILLIAGVIANPNTVAQSTHSVKFLPVNLYINGDTFYYLLYGLLGRAIGMLETQYRHYTLIAAATFVVCIALISFGTHTELARMGNFADTFYVYCGPLVFIAAICLFVIVKNSLNHRPVPGLALVSRHSLGIYGFHAFFIHALRTRHIEVPGLPLVDIVWIFSATLIGSLLLSICLQHIDTRRFVS